MKNEPCPGWTTQVYIKRVVDGDTIEVELRRTFPVRLIHDDGMFDAPPKRTQKGKEGINYLNKLFFPIKTRKDYIYNDSNIDVSSDNMTKALLYIPANDEQDLTDVLSFRRVLGELWINGKNVADLMLEKGYAILKAFK